MISDQIKQLILERIEFPDAEALEAVEKLADTAGALGLTGAQYNAVFPDGSGDAIAGNILKLADIFADLADAEKAQAVKEAFNGIFSAPTPEQEAAGEALMAAALEFDLAANALNRLLEERLVDSDEA